jgi:hypothetical protein
VSRAVTLPALYPSPRFDSLPWTRARIESAGEDQESWEEVDTVDLTDVDEDPEKPGVRSLTAVIPDDAPWARVVYLDAAGHSDEPGPAIATSGIQYKPTVKDVAALLRARTYSDSAEPDDDAEDTDAGGTQIGTFTDNTNPTADEVKETIDQAADDVSMVVGIRLPAAVFKAARFVTALRAANLIELGYIPEQTGDEGDRTVYQSVRLTYEDEVEKLSKNVQWWTLNERMEKRLAEEAERR